MITRSTRRNASYDWLSLSGVSDTSKWVRDRSPSGLFGQYIIAPKPILVRFEGSDYPVDISHILDAVRESRSILELEDDWDDEGSPAYSESTWKRATDFLIKNSLRLWQNYRISIEAPRILPGPGGSIDIHWRINGHELLVNFLTDENALATYYGDDKAGGIIKGSLNTTARNQWLMMWLAE